jgi:hypothetical protein
MTAASPARIRQITVEELKSTLDGGGALELWDATRTG